MDGTYQPKLTLFTPRRVLMLSALVVAGESVFFLPFVIARIFKPALLEVFGITNSELGFAFSIYGMVAMAAYLLGGPLADKFRPRSLIAISLITTSLGGIVFLNFPTKGLLYGLYAYWGLTTIALLWAALIKATREWGGELSQGAAFGLLDGGRGLLSAATGTVALLIYSSSMPEDIETATLAMREESLRKVILTFGSVTLFASVLVWFALPKEDTPREDSESTKPDQKISFADLPRLAKMPVIWLHALIIVCAYAGFKATDDFAHYANVVLGMDEIEAARTGTYSLWVRFFSAVGFGFIADRFRPTRMILVCFGILLTGSVLLSFEFVPVVQSTFYLLTIIFTSVGIFALRGLYFAIMGEGHIPLACTGSAVGMISVIGYTPDIFMPPLIGNLLDKHPGAQGHHEVFMVVAGFATLGLLATLLFIRMTSQTPESKFEKE